MAQFNPTVPPTSDPNYLRLSQGYKDETAEVALKGLGTLVGEGIKAADTLTKQGLQQEIWDKINPIREEETAKLLLGRGMAQSQPGANETGTDTPLDILGYQEEKTVPESVKDRVAQIRELTNARANGKPSATEYQMRLNAVAKELRAQYPGYREYIDNQVSNIVGGDPANKAITSLMGDIAAAQSGTNAEKNKVLSFLLREGEGLPDLEEAVKKVQLGQWRMEDAVRYVTPKQVMEYKYKLGTLQHTAASQNRERKQWSASEAIESDVDNQTALTMRSIIISNKEGMPKTMGEAMDLAEKASRGEIEIPSNKAVEMGLAIQAAIRTERQKLINKYAKDGLHTSLSGGMGELIQKVDNKLKPLLDWSKTISDKQFDLATLTASLADAKVSDVNYGVLSTKELGARLAFLRAFKDVAPAWGMTISKEFLKADMDVHLGKFLEDDLVRMYTRNAGVTPDGARSDDPRNVNDLMKRMKEAGRRGRVRETDLAKGSQIVLDNAVYAITDTKQPERFRVAAIKSLFSGDGRELINTHFKPDGVDPQTGRPMSGQWAAFNRLTQSGVTRAVKELDTKNPGLWNMYQNWVENTFANSVFKRELGEFKNMALTPNTVLSYRNGQFKLDVNPTVLTKERAAGIPAQAGSVMPVYNEMFTRQKALVERLNGGLRNLQEVAKAGNYNVDEFLLSRLIEQGFDPRKAQIRDVPEAIVRALMKSRIEQGKSLNNTVVP